MWEEGRQRAAGGFVFFGKKLMTAKDAKNGRLRDCDSLPIGSRLSRSKLHLANL
jgi:hypothetical protein